MVGMHYISLSWELSVVVKNTGSVKWGFLWYNSAIVLATDSCVCLSCRYKRCEIPWSRKWQSTSVFLPGKLHGQRSLVGYSPWGHKELTLTERLNTHTYTIWESLEEDFRHSEQSFYHNFHRAGFAILKRYSRITALKPTELKWWGSLGRFVTQSELILLATWQANKSRDKLLQWEIVTLFGKPANPRRWWTHVLRNILT